LSELDKLAEEIHEEIEDYGGAAVVSNMDLCLSEIEDILEEGSRGSAPPWTKPKGEAARLLKELHTNAQHFDVKDYWVNGAWDLEGLREDAEVQREERWAHEEHLWRQDAAVPTATSPQRVHVVVADDSQQDRSPSPEYPIFSSVQPQRLALTVTGSFSSVPRVGRFAKSTLRAESDGSFGQKLRQLFGS